MKVEATIAPPVDSVLGDAGSVVHESSSVDSVCGMSLQICAVSVENLALNPKP